MRGQSAKRQVGLIFSCLSGVVFERMKLIKIERVLNITLTQDEDFGHRTPQDPAEKMRESHRILHENTGKRRNMEAVFRPKITGITRNRPFPGRTVRTGYLTFKYS